MSDSFAVSCSNDLASFSRAFLNFKPNTFLSPSQLRLIIYLKKYTKTGLPPSKIGEHLHMARPSVTTLIASLERDGYVKRVANKNDKRSFYIHLTQRGQYASKEGMQAFCTAANTLVEKMGEEKCKQLCELASIAEQILRDA